MTYIDSYGRVIFSDELYHHGIRGQKWGVRNGDYYPLLPGQHSASENRAGWQKSLAGGAARRSKPAFGETYTSAVRANADRKKRSNSSPAGRSSTASSTSGSGGGGSSSASSSGSKAGDEAYRAELRQRALDKMNGSTDEKKSKSKTGSGGSKSGRKGSGKAATVEDNTAIEELRKDLEEYRKELEGTAASEEELTSGSEEKDEQKEPTTVEESVNEKVELDKFKETVESLLESKDEDEVIKIMKEEFLESGEDENELFDDKEKEYLLDMIDDIIKDFNAKKKKEDGKVIKHACINNRGQLVYYDDLYHYSTPGMRLGIRRF